MSATPSQKLSGITYVTQGSSQKPSSDSIRQVGSRDSQTERRADTRSTSRLTSGSRNNSSVVVTYTNPATINRSIMSTAERNQQQFKKQKIRQINNQLRQSDTDYQPNQVTNLKQNTYTTPLTLRIQQSQTKTKKNKLKLQVARSGTLMLNGVGWFFWTLGLYFLAAMLTGIAIELTTSWVPDFVMNWVGQPGKTLILLGYLLLVFFGLLILASFAILYAFTYRAAFAGYSGLVFLLVAALYLVPFLNFLPWFFIWTIFVLPKITVDSIKSKGG